jgi:hypothetical protein
VIATFAWIKPEVAEWAEAVPDGLLDLDVWLTLADQVVRVRSGGGEDADRRRAERQGLGARVGEAGAE